MLVQVIPKKPILATTFVMTSVVDMKGILVDCGKKLTVSADTSSLVFGM